MNRNGCDSGQLGKVFVENRECTTPIAEADLLPYPEILPDPVAVADDRILALLLSQDETQEGAKKGVIALQLHAGPPMQVQFKDLVLKED